MTSSADKVSHRGWSIRSHNRLNPGCGKLTVARRRLGDVNTRNDNQVNSPVIAFIRLGRPHFLFGGFLLYGLGAVVALRGGAAFQPRIYALGQAAIATLQLMTHYANDYFDLAADRANTTPTRWSGGSRILPSGTLSPRIALKAAGVLAGIGALLIAAIGLVGGAGGHVAAATLVLAGVLAWTYSAPPVALHSRGLGEVTTAVVVTGLTPLVAFTLQAGELAHGSHRGAAASVLSHVVPLLLAVLPLVGLQFVMLLTIEFPDAAGDAAVGKRTLVVRLGPPLAAAVCRAVLVAIYVSIPLLVMAGLPFCVGLGVAALGPFAAWQFWRLHAGAWGDPGQWEGLAFRAVGLLVATAGAELAAFIFLLARR